jgi:hypothetical protein
LPLGLKTQMTSVQQVLAQMRKPFLPAFPLLGILTAFPVYSRENGSLYMVAHLGLTFTAKDDEIPVELRESILSTFALHDKV